MVFPRTFKVSLLISMLIHMGAFAVVSHESVTQRIKTGPVIVEKQKTKPTSVRFELIETPASAKASKPPTKTNLRSDKNTQAQDRFESEKKLEDAPHMEGKHEDVKDTRPRMIASKPSKPIVEKAAPQKEPQSEPEKPREKEKPKEQKAKKALSGLPAEKKEKPKEPDKEIRIEPEPKPKEIKKLAKKMPDPAESVTPAPSIVPSRMMSAVSAGNTGADARITGDLSFAASRHFFGEYLVKMKQAVEREWVSRLVSQYTGVRSSHAVIDFKIQPDGKVTDIAVNSVEGEQYFAVMCVSSINDAQPFDEIPYAEAQGLPEEFVNKPLNIRFTFRYN